MSSFFKHSRVACHALYADFTYQPYYDVWFHLDAFSHFICHILRTLYDGVSLFLRLLATPFYVLNPFSWLGIPKHLLDIIDDVAAMTVSTLTTILHPLVSVFRTLTSLCFGYKESALPEDDKIYADAEANSDLACTIW